MLDSTCRSFYQKLLIDPLLSLPFAKTLSPMMITIIGLFFGLLVPVFLVFHYAGLALVSLLLSGYFDTLDGSLARQQKIASPLGAVFDITCDRLVEFSVMFGLFMCDPETRGIPCFLMVGSVLLCVTSFLVVGIFLNNQSEKSFYYSPGLIERSEAFVFWIAMILWPKAFSLFSYTFTTLVFLTTFIRLFQFTKKTLLRT